MRRAIAAILLGAVATAGALAAWRSSSAPRPQAAIEIRPAVLR